MSNRLLGEGTFGSVYREIYNNKTYAIKYVKVEETKTINILDVEKHLMKEVDIATRLIHPNVIKTYYGHIVNRNNEIYIQIVMDYCHRKNLHYFILNHNIAHRVPMFLMNILNGLHYIHSMNIIHRDIKPQNILVDYHYNLKICDFGIAREHKLMDDLNTHTPQMITIWYRPPELLIGSNNYSYEIDVYSAGCIFGEMLTGKPLFRGKDTMNGRNEILNSIRILQDYLATQTSNQEKLLLAMINNSKDRISIIDAMRHPYFADPLPNPPSEVELFNEAIDTYNA